MLSRSQTAAGSPKSTADDASSAAPARPKAKAKAKPKIPAGSFQPDEVLAQPAPSDPPGGGG